MALDTHTKLASIHTSAEASGENIVFIDEAILVQAFETPIPAEGDWTYSATAEGRTGEVATTVNGVSVDADDLEGFIYSGQPGGAVRVKLSGLVLTPGIIAPTEGNTYTAALTVNNTVVQFADEGYVDLNEAATTFNLDTYVGGLQVNDVLRVVFIPEEGLTNEEADVTVSEAGALIIV